VASTREQCSIPTVRGRLRQGFAGEQHQNLELLFQIHPKQADSLLDEYSFRAHPVRQWFRLMKQRIHH
jgi:hypothetical protein